jgi:probable HAF family extracellular repeat protein
MATMKRKSFLIVLLCACAMAVAALSVFLTRKPPVLYRMTYLPTLGGAKTDPHAINDRGQVVGVADTPTGAVYVFLWDKEHGFRTIDRYDDPPHVGGLCINNAGQVVGTMADPNANQRAFFWDLNAGRQLLGTLGGTQSSAEGMNNLGQVVGSAEVRARYRHAFVWGAAAGMRDLSTLGGLNSCAVSINDSGQIVGFAETADNRNRVVVWEPVAGDARQNTQDGAATPPPSTSKPPSVDALKGPPGYRLTDIGDAGVGPIFCEINNRGLVVRRLCTTSGKTYFLTWTRAAGTRTLDFVINSGLSVGLNEKDQFLIRAKPTGLRMFGRVFHLCHQCYLWDPNSGPLLLESHLPVKDIAYFTVREVNNEGQIAAAIRTKDSNQIRAVVLEREGN